MDFNALIILCLFVI